MFDNFNFKYSTDTTTYLQANLYPAMILVGWIFCFTNSSAFFNNSAATMTYSKLGAKIILRIFNYKL